MYTVLNLSSLITTISFNPPLNNQNFSLSILVSNKLSKIKKKKTFNKLIEGNKKKQAVLTRHLGEKRKEKIKKEGESLTRHELESANHLSWIYLHLHVSFKDSISF
jgi:hypothetical protein